MIDLFGSQPRRIWNHEVPSHKQQYRGSHEHKSRPRSEIAGVDVIHVWYSEEGYPGRERLADDADTDCLCAQAVGGELGGDGPAHSLD